MSSSACPTRTNNNNESIKDVPDSRTETEKAEKREVIETVTKDANDGNTDAMYRLGCMLFNGDGVDENKSSAIEWW